MIDKLQGLTPEGTPPESRIKDAQSAQQVWSQLWQADAVSSFERARMDAAYDGEVPYSQAQLTATGQAFRCNVSWGFAPMVLDMAMSGYIDIINSSEVLFECPTNYKDEGGNRSELEQGIAEEVTDCIRSWRDFNIVYQQLVSTFIKHGVSVAIFNDEIDWRWTSSGLSDFKIPRRTKVGQDNIDVACFLRFYSATQLYQLIKFPEVAEKLGYNVEAIKQTILKSIQNSNTFIGYRAYNWEKLEIELRNNDYFFTYGTASTQNIRVVHMFWQEFDGRISYGMFNDDNTAENWLYLKNNRFPKTENAFVMFTYGVGTNGYVAGIRGQGFTVYPINAALNRLYCQAMELAAFGTAPTFQPQDESAMQEMQFVPNGPYNLLTPRVTVIPSSIAPNLSTGVMPIIGAMTQMFRERTANANTQALLDSTKEQTATEVEAKLGSIAKMSVASLNLFYDPFETLFREKVRRMKRRDYKIKDPGGEFIMGLHKRLLKRGGKAMLEAFFELDTDRLRIKKAIGSGSEAARMLAFNRMMELWPYMDDFGRQNAMRDLVAEYVGYRNANRYVQPPAADLRTDPQAPVAELQNDALLKNGVATVRPDDNHFVHARVHMEALIPVNDQVREMLEVVDEQPQMVNELATIIQGLQAINAHTAEHVARLSQDARSAQMVGEFKRVLQNVDEQVNNGALHIEKLQREQAEKAQAAGQEFEPAVDPKVLADLEKQQALTQAKIDSINAVTDTKVNAAERMTQQKLAAQDLLTAQKVRQTAIQGAQNRRKEPSK